jgi:hypothetical protein
LGDLGVGHRIILKLELNKYDKRVGIRLTCLRIGSSNRVS